MSRTQPRWDQGDEPPNDARGQSRRHQPWGSRRALRGGNKGARAVPSLGGTGSWETEKQASVPGGSVQWNGGGGGGRTGAKELFVCSLGQKWKFWGLPSGRQAQLEPWACLHPAASALGASARLAGPVGSARGPWQCARELMTHRAKYSRGTWVAQSVKRPTSA